MAKTPIPRLFLVRQISAITAGAFLAGAAINLFLVPHAFVKGGVSGAAILIHYIAWLPVWAWILILNIPIFAYGFKVLGHGFIAGSLYGTGALSAFVYLTEGFAKLKLSPDPMISALFGGVMGGIGIGITLRVNGSLGGTDIIGAIVQKRLSISIGTVSFIINGVIVLLASFLFGSSIASFALLTIFMEAIALDKSVRGIDTSKAIFIITNKPQEIAQEIMLKLNRGVTYLQGEGAYYGNPRKVLYCVVSLRQLARVKFYVKQADPQAFMSVADVSEVLGKGFRPSPF